MEQQIIPMTGTLDRILSEVPFHYLAALDNVVRDCILNNIPINYENVSSKLDWDNILPEIDNWDTWLDFRYNRSDIHKIISKSQALTILNNIKDKKPALYAYLARFYEEFSIDRYYITKYTGERTPHNYGNNIVAWWKDELKTKCNIRLSQMKQGITNSEHLKVLNHISKLDILLLANNFFKTFPEYTTSSNYYNLNITFKEVLKLLVGEELLDNILMEIKLGRTSKGIFKSLSGNYGAKINKLQKYLNNNLVPIENILLNYNNDNLIYKIKEVLESIGLETKLTHEYQDENCCIFSANKVRSATVYKIDRVLKIIALIINENKYIYSLNIRKTKNASSYYVSGKIVTGHGNGFKLIKST